MSGDPRAFNAGYDASPELYDSLRDCWLNQRRLLFVAAALERAGLPADAAILELGSGTGWLLTRLAARFPGWRFTGLEPLPGYVEFARRESRGTQSRWKIARFAARSGGSSQPWPAAVGSWVTEGSRASSGCPSSRATDGAKRRGA